MATLPMVRLVMLSLLLQSAITIIFIWRSSAICRSAMNLQTLNTLTYPRADCDGMNNQSTPTASKATVSMATAPVKKIAARKGVILALRFWEQQTQAMRSLLQLQCLAHSYDMGVVEPFLLKSFLAFPFDDMLKGIQHLRFGQLIDLDLWNTEIATEYGYRPVVQWDNFLKEAPRKVIVVCIKYRDPPHIRLPSPGYDYRNGCPPECFNRFNSTFRYLQKHGFTLLQQRCANFLDFGNAVTASSFKETVIGRYHREDITIMLTEFRGFYGLFRLPVLTDCGIKHFRANITTLPSSQIESDAKAYVANKLNSQQYVAVLARVERLVLHLHYNTTKCIKELDEVLKQIYTTHKISQRFLSMDVGKFGTYLKGGTESLVPHAQQIFNTVYGNDWTYNDWENSFETGAYSNTPAYIANMQRSVAARSKCLVSVAGGGFQKQAMEFYMLSHPNPQTHCIYKVCQKRVD